MSLVETNTNQLLRKKYYVESSKIITKYRPGRKNSSRLPARIIDSTRVVVSDQERRLFSTAPPDEEIKVQTIKQGHTVKGLHIACPCGRTADLDIQYQDSP